MAFYYGKAEVYNSSGGERYLKGWINKTQFIGLFDKKESNLIFLVYDEKRIDELTNKNINSYKIRSRFFGKAVVYKTLKGINYLKGWDGNIPFIGYFDKNEPNIIHLVLDEKKITELSNKNKNSFKAKKALIRQYMKS